MNLLEAIKIIVRYIFILIMYYNKMNPLPDPVEPTEANIIRLRSNLKNLQHFNDQLYTYTITKTENCFLLLTKTDSGDPGLNVGLNLLCGAMIGIGADYGIIGAVIANYFCGLVSEYSVATPPSLLTSYTSYSTRIQATSIQADIDMENSNVNPAQNWNTIRSGSFDTPWGSKTASCTLGQLAAIDVPNEIDTLYGQMMTRAVYCFEQMLWWSVINQNYQVNGLNTGYMMPTIIPASEVSQGDAGMNKYCNNYMTELPPHWTYWLYSHTTDKKGRDTSTYEILDYSVGSPPNNGHDQPITDAAARYLFIDTIPGTIVNANGLFNRYFVFNQFGLKRVGF